MLSLRKDDVVQVISGRDKGKVGKVLKVDVQALLVTVEKINMVKRHLKPSQKNPQGGIQEKELPLAAGKVLIFCNTCKRGVRHGKKVDKKATTRVCKRCKNSVGAA